MGNYIQLLTLTPEGRSMALQNSRSLLKAQDQIAVEGVRVLGQYAVLGDYDFVCIVEAPDNESVARFSIELGVRAGVHITTLPAIPVALLEGTAREPVPELDTRVTLPPPLG